MLVRIHIAGLVHKSEISTTRVDEVADVLSVGDQVFCKVLSHGVNMYLDFDNKKCVKEENNGSKVKLEQAWSCDLTPIHGVEGLCSQKFVQEFLIS